MAHRRRGHAIEIVPRVALKRARGQAPVKVSMRFSLASTRVSTLPS
jgi:hypothetical protein